jgi:hypothetical protein
MVFRLYRAWCTHSAVRGGSLDRPLDRPHVQPEGGGMSSLTSQPPPKTAAAAAGLAVAVAVMQGVDAVATAVRIDSAVLVALASLYRRSWPWLFCSRLCGRRRRL